MQNMNRQSLDGTVKCDGFDATAIVNKPRGKQFPELSRKDNERSHLHDEF